jgi:hypothetical protein
MPIAVRLLANMAAATSTADVPACITVGTRSSSRDWPLAPQRPP